MEYDAFLNVINSKAPIFLSGIGGVSMRALAVVLRDRGAFVYGSDRDESEAVEWLRGRGIGVFVPQRAENVREAALVIRTAAVRDDNPEIKAAREKGVYVMERAEAWGLLMLDYEKVVCVAGTHGKTTTTAMLATLGIDAGLDPTVMVGGEMSAISGTVRVGSKKLMVAEACEYKNSFLRFNPTVSVILNVEFDHPDFFHDVNAVVSSFRSFALKTAENGTIVYRGDDENTCRALVGVDRKKISFGLSDSCDVRAENIRLSGTPEFDVVIGGEKWAEVKLPVSGEHNVLNALAAAAAAYVLGVSGERFVSSMAGFCGVGRRMEHIRSYMGAEVFDDYAHHPSEIEATLKTAKSIADGRVLCVFQPHTYSRTAALLDDFAKALSIADKVCVCPVYSARETDDLGISAQTLADRIDGAVAVGGLSAAARWIENNVSKGDLVLTMGAGDVFKTAYQLRSEKMHIISVREKPEYKASAVKYFEKVWGNEENRQAIENAISYSLITRSFLPRYYLLEEDDEIIGCAGLITNDYISRQDLSPWICSVYIAPEKRGKGLGAVLLDHARMDAKKAGFEKVYIATRHIGYYEHFGFKHIGTGYHPWGESARIYEGNT